ncbi:MAG: hypothetical protein Q8L14_30945 [Myxococcales bacterium]|nr:hypothetical protein [Myxococcales bacterium]
MAFISLKSIVNVVKPFATSIIKSVAPGVVDSLKNIAGSGITSLFEAGSKGLQGLLGKLPIVGPLASGLVEKYAPKLADIAKNFVNGGLDKLLGKIVGQPTERPVPGTGGQVVTTPPLETRAPTIVANTPPSSNGNASTGVGGSPAVPSTPGGATGVGSGATPSGGFPKYPTPPSDPKDLAAQNKFQEDMFNFQQASQNLNMYWQMMQNTLKSMGDTLRNSIGALR